MLIISEKLKMIIMALVVSCFQVNITLMVKKMSSELYEMSNR